MILEKTKFSISKQLVNPYWQLKIARKNFKQKFLAFLNVYYPKTNLIKALYSLDSSRSYGRILENPKTGSSRDLFLPESDFKPSSAVNF